MEDLSQNIKYWFFTNVISYEFDEDNYAFKFQSKRIFKGEENDKTVFLTKSPKGYLFSHRAKINSIEKVKSEPLTGYFYTITIIDLKKIKGENYLDNYIYSIRRIKDFNNPLKYFKLPYGEFTNVEYEAVTQNNFFVARTKFGKYINALPKEHKIAFIEYFIQFNADLYFNDFKNFKEGLKILELYIENRITQPVRYLKEGYLYFNKLVSNDEIEGIGFSNRNNKVDYFKTQYDRCQEYLNLKDNPDLEEEFTGYYYNNSQYKFQQLFRNTPWPIIIN